MALFIDLLAAKHPCIFAPETTSFTAGRPCSERVRSRAHGVHAFGLNVEGSDSSILHSATRVAAPGSTAGCVGRGNSMLRGNDIRRRQLKKDPRMDLQVEYTQGSTECLLTPSRGDGQKVRGGVVGLMRGAAKGLFQQMRVGRQHQHFL